MMQLNLNYLLLFIVRLLITQTPQLEVPSY